jgi:glycosyltransferase involved in cell wall biosynthesis
MHILHISNDFPNTSLYNQLVLHLSELGIKQSIYSAVRTSEEARYNPPELKHFEASFRNILQPYDRILYRHKINKTYKDVVRQINLKQIDLVHAHTLYSDGGVALKLKKKLDIPFITAIRSTDIYIFSKYRPDLHWYRNKILLKAEKVIFISHAHKDKFLNLISNNLKKSISDKIAVIPNGIYPSFLEKSDIPNNYNNNLKLLYVGTFIKRKNVLKIVEAANILSKDKNIVLTIVGGGDDKHAKLRKIITSDKYSFIQYLGKINNKKELQGIYASHDIFVMASYQETFGLVYIEALAQGLPIILAKGEGVNGYFKNSSIVETINDIQDEKEIARKISFLSERLSPELSKECIKASQRFDWKRISKKYKNIYRSICQ